MKLQLTTIAAVMLFAAPGFALAQTDANQPQTTPPAQMQNMSPQMMQSMMQMMQGCMGMMQMMQGNMQNMPMQGGMQGNMPMMQGGGMMGNMQGGGMMSGAAPTGAPDFTAGYMAAMSKMDAPMMQGAQAGDPDIAFVKGMIPHHQGAIDMAKVELQYGKDDKIKDLANGIIAAQEKEIALMQDWLKAHGE